MSMELLESIRQAAHSLQAQMPGGMADQMGLRVIDCDPDGETALFESATPPAWMRNPMGWLHGGMIAALLDSAMGIYCAVDSGGAGTPTISMNLNYLRPTPADRPLHIRAHIVRHGAHMVFAEALLWAEDETRPCAAATGVYHLPARA